MVEVDKVNSENYFLRYIELSDAHSNERRECKTLERFFVTG